ncbi:hypothetical protein Tco_0121767 [Tanacetum coccineum]
MFIGNNISTSVKILIKHISRPVRDRDAVMRATENWERGERFRQIRIARICRDAYLEGAARSILMGLGWSLTGEWYSLATGWHQISLVTLDDRHNMVMVKHYTQAGGLCTGTSLDYENFRGDVDSSFVSAQLGEVN